MFSNQKVYKLRRGYLKANKNKGCRSVQFYLRGIEICDYDATVHSLNLDESDTLVAVWNDPISE